MNSEASEPSLLPLDTYSGEVWTAVWDDGLADEKSYLIEENPITNGIIWAKSSGIVPCTALRPGWKTGLKTPFAPLPRLTYPSRTSSRTDRV